MRYVIGLLAGIVWGALAALLNTCISKACIKRSSVKSMMVANLARTAVDIAALAAVFLVRNLVPFSFELALVGTAISMSMITIVFAYKISRPEKKEEILEEKTGE